MHQPVAIRSAWAQRIICNLAARLDGIGRRGGGGMDTCEIHPLDLLAGSMPAQSLTEGRYLVDYALDDDRETERFSWYNLSLGPNSGVGHIVPGYEQLLRGGIKDLRDRIDEAERSLSSDDPDRAKAAITFYAAARLATAGLMEYLSGLAD